MEFLKAILSEQLYRELETALNAHNGNEANRDKQIKLANLAGGEYVGKGKYDALSDLLKGKETELNAANELIAGFKKSEKGNEDLQGKITAYETQNAQLQEQLKQKTIDSECKVALLAAGVKSEDLDYAMFKLKAEGELDLDADGKVKGLDEKITKQKTQLPKLYDAADGGANGGYKPFENNGLPRVSQEQSVTREQFANMSFEERMNLKKTNETLYKQYAKN